MTRIGFKVGGVLKLVNLVNIFLQADSISFKGIYPGYKNEKLKKMRLTPNMRNFKFLEIFTSAGNFLEGPKKILLEMP